MLDTYYISIYNNYKKAYGKKSITIALIYICLLELAFALLLGAFFLAFAVQMKIPVMSTTKFWVLYSVIAVFILFKNWMRYNGKKRTVLNATSKRNNTSVYLLWLMPLGGFILAFVLLQVS